MQGVDQGCHWGEAPLETKQIEVLSKINHLNYLINQHHLINVIMSFPHGYMSFRPTPFQPLQFQPLQFQPFTLSTVLTFNRWPFRPLANSTAANSTYLIKFKVIQFFQDVRKQVK